MALQNYLICESCLMKEDHSPVEGSIEFISYLSKHHVPFLIVTNQSQRSREALCKQYQQIGYRSLKPEHFYTSTMAGVDLLRKQFPKKTVAGYIGTKAMKDTLQMGGFAVNLDYADYVFVGVDQHATFQDYCYVLGLLKKGALLLSTDDSASQIDEDGKFIIGPGAICKMLEEASGQKIYSLGMPNANLALQSLLFLQVEKEDTLFIGSKIDQEIVSGKKAGLKTVLLTSAMDEMDNAFLNETQPDYVVETLLGLLR